MIVDTWALNTLVIAISYFAVTTGTKSLLEPLLSATKITRLMNSIAPLLNGAIKVDVKKEEQQ